MATTRRVISGHQLQNTWYAMKARCYNPKDPSYKRYGGRGIVMCERWRLSFWDFVADVGDRPAGCTADRIDNDGDYCPENFRWATKRSQQNNTRANVHLAYRDRKYLLTELAEEVGIDASVLRSRICKGWDIERAVSQKPRRSPCKTLTR